LNVAKESEKLLTELKAWANAEYGRRAELARMLGVSRQLVSEWFAGRATPTWDNGMRIEELLRKLRRAKSRGPR
jgi:transcriptional regulator with XRE-family HTH domain